LKENEKILHAMAQALIKYETIDSDQIDDIMKGKEPRPPKDWSPDNDNNINSNNDDDNNTVTELKPKPEIGEAASSH
jgi:cell division protease FtsH